MAELLEGKGAGKRGRYQGKATKMSRRGEVQALLQEFISQQTDEALSNYTFSLKQACNTRDAKKN